MPRRTEKRTDHDPEALLDEESGPTSKPFWSGTISFGLVTIPVDLYSATKSTRINLRMLAPSGTPVVRRYFSESGKPLDGGQIERGYELEKGEFVPVTDDELEALAPEQSRDIDLSRFVPREAIPPRFFERVYVLAPSGSSNVAYRLLAHTLERKKRAGMATFVMRGKQHAVAIVADGGILRAETLRFADTLRTPEDLELPEPEKPSAPKLKAMKSVIARATKSALPQRELTDTYWKRLETLVAKKEKRGTDLVEPVAPEAEQESLAEVIDLVAVLQKSLGQGAAAKKKASATTKRAATKRPAKRAARGR